MPSVKPRPKPKPASKPRKSAPLFATLGELLDRLGGISPHRVCADPPPGTVTLRDFARRDGRSASGAVCELIDRTLVEKPMGAPESVITMQMAGHIYHYLADNPIAFVVGAAYPIKVAPGLVRVPSFGVTMWATRPTGFFTTDPIAKEIPALVAVLLSPEHTAAEIARAVNDYFTAGVKQFWLVEIRKLEVWDYSAPSARTLVRGEASLTAPSILPGFQWPLADAFRYLPDPSAWETAT